MGEGVVPESTAVYFGGTERVQFGDRHWGSMAQSVMCWARCPA